MASALEGIIDAMITAVQVDHSAGSGTFDLSATDQVQRGTFTRNPLGAGKAFVCIQWPEKIPSSQGPDLVPMGLFARSPEIPIRGWAPYSPDTSSARGAAIADLLDDVSTALEDSHRTGSLNTLAQFLDVGDVEFSGVDVAQASGFARFDAIASIVYRTTRGY